MGAGFVYHSTMDLAGEVCFRPNFFQTKGRINHLTKFWGMGMWLYPDGSEQLIRYLLSQINTILAVSYESGLKTESNLKSEITPP